MALRDAICALSAAIVPLRSVTVNEATTALTGAARPTTAVAAVAPVAATVTVPAVATASFSVLDPKDSFTSLETSTDVDVTIDFEIDPSSHVLPISVVDTVSPPTGLPNTSVTFTVSNGIVPTADVAGTKTPTLYAGPTFPLT